MRREELRQEAMDPQTPRERLEALVDNAPEVHDVLILNPELPEDLRGYLIESSPMARDAWNRHLAEEQAKAQREAAASRAAAMRGPSTTSMTTPVPQPARSSGIVGKGCGCGCLVLIIIFVVVPIVAFLISLSSGGDDAAEPVESAQEKVSPAPDEAISASLIQSPSLNISCEIYESGVYCSIYERYYADAGLQDCSDTLFSISVTETVDLQCGNEYLGNEGDSVTTLEYGQSVATDGYACSSAEDGMTCWNQYTGNGFTISRSGYSTW
ncbi:MULTISPECIES: hypothetical protein [Actinomyces]|uniref:Leucine rich repeat variant domain-containing protein n=1 Tax=Actinomyces respiraculi TaxID=2744574 RepID=A0A7T0LJH3_9ACTO|nr:MULTISPECIES: hypothetical protein [Actinomyces]QPL04919.1 hypothetical protein ID810_09225 [Actinomyces respiraculi]